MGPYAICMRCLKLIPRFCGIRRIFWFLIGCVCGHVLRRYQSDMRKSEYSPADYRPVKIVHFNRTLVIDFSLAASIRHRSRILCYINTHPANHLTKAHHVRNTWARKCTRHLLLSSVENNELAITGLRLTVPDTREHLWSKVQSMMSYVNSLGETFDYYYKCDDDAYVVVENLESTLSDFCSAEKIFFGYPFYHSIREGHMTGGPGYVMSRAAFKAIMNEALNKNPSCPSYDEDKEDMKLTLCGYAVGVTLVHLVDRHTTYPFQWRREFLNEYRFQWNSLFRLFSADLKRPMTKPTSAFDANNPFVRDEYNMISAHLIAAHYVESTDLYTIEFILYHLRPVGIQYNY